MNELIRPKTIKTTQLLLREGRLEDTFDLYHNYTSDSVCARFLTRNPHKTILQTEKFIQEWCISPWKKPHNQFSWIISLPETNEPIGVFIVKIEHNKAEIHYGIGQKFWGKGLITEAGLAIVDWLKKTKEISLIWTICDVSHIASLKVLQKIGLQNKGLSEQRLKLPAFENAIHDFFMFSLSCNTKVINW